MQSGFFQPSYLGVAREIKEFWRDFFAHIRESFVPHHSNNYHPHIFSQRMVGLFSVLLVCVKLFTAAAISLGPVLPAFSSEITPTNIISLTNQSRQAVGARSLSENTRLSAAARAKAEDMLKNQYFAHNSPQGKVPWDFIKSAGYNYLIAGENLAVNFTDAESVENAWMNSPSHKANLLNKNYDEIGIGIAQGEFQGRQATFVVQMFGDPAEQAVKVSSVPTQVLTQSVPQPAKKPEVKGLAVEEATALPDGELMRITAQIRGDAVKVLAKYGERAIMLDPGKNGRWSGYVEAARLGSPQTHLEIVAEDIAGRSQSYRLAYFSPSLTENYNVLGVSQRQPEIKLYGVNFAPKETEDKFYLWFAVMVLSSLLLAVAVRHRIQHASLVMNGSLVVVLAILLWMAG